MSETCTSCGRYLPTWMVLRADCDKPPETWHWKNVTPYGSGETWKAYCDQCDPVAVQMDQQSFAARMVDGLGI